MFSGRVMRCLVAALILLFSAHAAAEQLVRLPDDRVISFPDGMAFGDIITAIERDHLPPFPPADSKQLFVLCGAKPPFGSAQLCAAYVRAVLDAADWPELTFTPKEMLTSASKEKIRLGHWEDKPLYRTSCGSNLKDSSVSAIITNFWSAKGPRYLASHAPARAVLMAYADFSPTCARQAGH